MEAFILVKKPQYTQRLKSSAIIRVNEQTYSALVEAAAKTGLSIMAVADKAIDFAMRHLQYVDEMDTQSRDLNEK
jgi:hypothetical protein